MSHVHIHLPENFTAGEAKEVILATGRSAPEEGLGSCGCTCCSGSWVLDAISYRCSGGCRCTARWYEGQPPFRVPTILTPATEEPGR